MTYTEEVAGVLKYFGDQQPATCCICDQHPEARPGVRLCRSCLRIAATCHAVIEAEEAAGTETP